MRVAVNALARVRRALYDADGEPAGAAGAVTVAVVSDSTGRVVASGSAIAEPGELGRYKFDFPAGAVLDLLRVTWSFRLDGVDQQAVEVVEVAGGHLCGLEQIDDSLARSGGTPAGFAARRKLIARDVAETAIEEALDHAALVPRYARRLLSGDGGEQLQLRTPLVRAVRSATIAGEPVDLGEATIDGGSIYRRGGWPRGRRNIDVQWEHGSEQPSATQARAGALLASSLLAAGPWDDRGYGVADEAGFTRLLTAGVGKAMFSIPEVEALVRRERGYRVA